MCRWCSWRAAPACCSPMREWAFAWCMNWMAGNWARHRRCSRCSKRSRDLKIRKAVAPVLLVLLLAAAVAGVWLWKAVHAAAITPGTATEVQELEVAQGASLRTVLRELEHLELIGNARQLEWYMRCCRAGKQIAAVGV